MTRWLAVAIAIVALFLALWIIVPAPTYFLLTFGVGGPEVSAWILVGSLIGIGLVVRDVRHSMPAKLVVAACAIAFALSGSIFARLPAVVRRFDAATRDLSATPAAPLRARPLVVRDLFLGIPRVESRVTGGIEFAKPNGVPLTLDVHRPRQPGSFPIVVQIYGGAWQRGDPTSHANFASWLASSGYVVFAIDYRHAPKWKWPTLIDDVDSALAWIAKHAAEYGGDTSRVTLLGRSAGAHLALLAAYRPAPLHIRAVVSYYGPTDLADAYRHPPHPDPLHARELEEALIGGTPDQMPEQYAEASPITYATRALPPTLLIYGRRDHSVEAKYGARLSERLAATGTPVAYLEIPWAEHAFDEVFNGPSSQISLFYTERFLAWATGKGDSDRAAITAR
ncbi:MAG TPA: alpha/beta hydrolase [Gemmatimonadaceae bacterium]